MKTSSLGIVSPLATPPTCLCGCGQVLDTSKSRGEPRLHFSDTCRKRYYRHMQRIKRHVTLNSPESGPMQEVQSAEPLRTTLEEAVEVVKSAPTTIRSPFRWVGGKLRLRKKIIGLLPPHDCYVEVFGGAAWVLLGKSPCQVEIFNDLDGEVVNFFRVIKDQPEAFLKSFEWDLVSRRVFRALEDLPIEHLSDVQRAHRFYYLIMAAWGGELGTPRFQTSVSDEGHGNRLIGALKTLRERIMPVYQRLQTVILEDLDWRECLARYDRSYEEKGVAMYLDPPYPNNNCNYRHNMTQWAEHEELAQALRRLRCRFLLTSYNLPEVRAIYDGFYITEVDFVAGMPTGKNRN
jgi:DNA adenine methylase